MVIELAVDDQLGSEASRCTVARIIDYKGVEDSDTEVIVEGNMEAINSNNQGKSELCQGVRIILEVQFEVL